MSGFISDKAHTTPSCYIQWKNTDACFDFYCSCGQQGHFDGYFAYTIKCSNCGQTFEMPQKVYPRLVGSETDQYWAENPKEIEMEGE